MDFHDPVYGSGWSLVCECVNFNSDNISGILTRNLGTHNNTKYTEWRGVMYCLLYDGFHISMRITNLTLGCFSRSIRRL